MKTLLRYPGGKSRAVKKIYPHLPKGLKEVCSPFFGGGSFEIEMANNGIKVFGYDSFEPLVDFWQEVFENNYNLCEEVKKKYPLKKEEFYVLQKEILDKKTKTKTEIAASFFAINRCSFSGSTLSGGMSPGHPRFNENSINKIKEFKANNISIECLDFKDSINKNKDKFLFLDPPYLIKNFLYGNKGDKHKNFDHEGLFNLIKNRNGWILCYNDCEYIRDLYSEFKIIELDWSYGMSKDKKSKEILILN